jgi:hypothetical protein
MQLVRHGSSVRVAGRLGSPIGTFGTEYATIAANRHNPGVPCKGDQYRVTIEARVNTVVIYRTGEISCDVP